MGAISRDQPTCGRVRVIQLVAGAVLVITGLGSCSGDDDGFATPVVEREVAPQADAGNLSLEEAGFIASGELVAIYGTHADPVPIHVEAEAVGLGDQRVWQLDIRVEVTREGIRTEREWRMWVGTAADGSPAVLRASERR